MQEQWTEVERYLEGLLVPADPALDSILKSNQTSDLPSIDVPPLLGKFLNLMVRISGARHVLEVGTLGGYSTVWMARALPPGGRLLTLELDARHAEIAQQNLKTAGVSDKVEIQVGPAVDSMRALHESGIDPFDLIFLDADKQSLPQYLALSLKLSRPGTVLIADNVVRDGKVVDPDNPDSHIQGVRTFLELAGSEPRISTTAIPSVGARGYDGFAIALVLS